MVKSFISALSLSLSLQCVCLSLKPKLKGEAEAEERKQSIMVSTRRNSGSLSAANSSKRPSSSEDKPPSPSPKRQKVPISNAYSFSFSLFLASLSDSFRFFFQADNGAVASEKPMPPAENSKELRTPEPPADPGECGHADAQITGTAAADDKADATPPIADGTSLPLTFQSSVYLLRLFILFIYYYCKGSSPSPNLVADKPRASFSSWSIYQKQNPNFESSAPWGRLLSQCAQVIHLVKW